MFSVITVAYGDRKRLMLKPPSYARLLQRVRIVFPQLRDVSDDGDVTVHFKPEWGSDEVELDASAYEVVHDHASLRIVKTKQTYSESSKQQGGDMALASRPNLEASERREVRLVTVSLDAPTGKIEKFEDVPTTSTVAAVKARVLIREGIPIHQQRLYHGFILLKDHWALAEYGITQDCHFRLYMHLVGGKPAIYLLSPQAIEKASVTVELSREWDFTVIYPLVDKSHSSKYSTSKITWEVSVDESATILDKSGRGYSYLFWEAETKPSILMNDDEKHDQFNPTHPIIDIKNAVVLPFHLFIEYLDVTLENLQLTVAMRTDFMTYWMPKFLRIRDQGLDIASTFVNQRMFNEAARLIIKPQPSTVARIFMLFGGVDTSVTCSNRSRWAGMRSDADRAAEMGWADIIGLDIDTLKDETVFRAIEWGGMEVHDVEETLDDY